MHMPKPTEHHAKLEMLAGQWQGTETMYPSQWDPEGGTAIGRNDIRLALSNGGPGMHARLTYDLSQAGILRSRMEMSQDGEEWATFFEGEYRQS